MNPDLLIIGGGVIGLSIARELHKKGARNIVIVDKGICGHEASWAAAGMLTPQSEADETGPFFDLCVESRDLFPQFAAELLDETGIDIELDRTGTLSLAFNDLESRELLDRYRRQMNAGLVVESLSQEEVLRREPCLAANVAMGLFFENDWQVENRKLVNALRRYAELNGITLVENTDVKRLIFDRHRVIEAQTTDGRIGAGQTVLATGAWTSLIKLGGGAFPFSIEPVRGQIIAFEAGKRLLRHVVHSPRGYIVPRRDGRLLVGSTSEHQGFEDSVTRDARRILTAAACEIAPWFKGLEVVDQWSGLRPFAPDGLPVLGRLDSVDNLFVATAHYRNGILLAPVTAGIIAHSLLDGVESEYCVAFGPDRFGVTSVGAAM